MARKANFFTSANASLTESILARLPESGHKPRVSSDLDGARLFSLSLPAHGQHIFHGLICPDGDQYETQVSSGTASPAILVLPKVHTQAWHLLSTLPCLICI